MSRQGIFSTGFCDPQHETLYWFISHEVPAKDPEEWITHGAESEMIRAEVRERVKDIKIPLIDEIVEKSPQVCFYPVYKLPLGRN